MKVVAKSSYQRWRNLWQQSLCRPPIAWSSWTSGIWWWVLLNRPPDISVDVVVVVQYCQHVAKAISAVGELQSLWNVVKQCMREEVLHSRCVSCSLIILERCQEARAGDHCTQRSQTQGPNCFCLFGVFYLWICINCVICHFILLLMVPAFSQVLC